MNNRQRILIAEALSMVDVDVLNDNMAATGHTLTAAPYTARQCRECGVWVYVADGPFAEGDRTKTLADWEHWDREHETPERRAEIGAIGFPYMSWNEEPVEIPVLPATAAELDALALEVLS